MVRVSGLCLRVLFLYFLPVAQSTDPRTAWLGPPTTRYFKGKKGAGFLSSALLGKQGFSLKP